jgi:hypothetical protein
MRPTYGLRKKVASPKSIDPRIKWLRATRRGDRLEAYLASVELYRDPHRWFASAIESGMPRLWARGDSEQEVRTRLECAVADRVYAHSKIRVSSDWQVVVHPPDGHEDDGAWIDWPVDGVLA